MTDIQQVTELRAEARDALQEALYEIKRVIVGQDAMLERLLVSLLSNGHVLLEGVPGPGQDADRQDAGGGARRVLQPRPVHARPGPRGPRRHARLPPRQRWLRHRARPGVHEFPARRRDQPRAGKGAVGAARGDAGAAGDDRRHDLQGATPVHRDGDAEPDRVGGDLPVARGAGRPLPDEDPRRLSERRRGGGRRRAQPRRAGRRARVSVARGPHPLCPGNPVGARRSGRDRVRGGARRRDAQSRPSTGSRRSPG